MEFLRNDDNKRELFSFLSQKPSKLETESQVIATHHEDVLCTQPRNTTNLTPCTQEEAYEAPFKTECHQCFRNLYRTSNIYISDVQYIYIGRPIYIYRTSNIYISDIQYIYIRRPIYIYPTSDIYIRCPISISDVQYPCPSPSPCASRGRYCISDVGYRYRTSDIYILNV